MGICRDCGEEKDNSEFPVRAVSYKKDLGGIGQTKVRSIQYRICFNKYFQEYRKKDPHSSKRIKKNKYRIYDEVSKWKTDAGCNRCGYNKCSIALHYHHIKPEEKDYEISWAVWRG